MFERISDRARKVMRRANEEAYGLGHELIATEDLLLGLIKEESGSGVRVLTDLGVDLERVRVELQGPRDVGVSGTSAEAPRLPQTRSFKKVIEYAIDEARKLGHNYLGSHHLVLGLLRAESSEAAQVLAKLGVRIGEARQVVMHVDQTKAED